METKKLLIMMLVIAILISTFAGCNRNKIPKSSSASSSKSSSKSSSSGSSSINQSSTSSISGSSKNSSSKNTSSKSTGSVSLPRTDGVILKSSFTPINLQMRTQSPSGLQIPTKESVGITDNTVRIMQPGGGGDWLPGGMFYDGIKKLYGVTVELIPTPEGQIIEKLAQSINSNNAPDIVAAALLYPSLPVAGVIQPVDNLINYDLDIMKYNKSIYNTFNYKNVHFALPFQNIAETALYYNSQIFEDNLMETPLQLLAKGKWDWDAFAAAAKNLTKIENGVVKRYGALYVNWQSSQLVFTTGVNYVKESNGVFANNLNNTAYSRAFSFLIDLVNKKYVWSNRDIGTTNIQFDRGNSAMILAPGWAGTNINWFPDTKKSGVLECAPLPKDPQASSHVVPGMNTSMFVPIGAKNAGGIRAVVYGAATVFTESMIKGTDSYNDLKAKNMTGTTGLTVATFDKLVAQYRNNNQMNLFMDAYRGTAYEMDTIYSAMAGATGNAPISFEQAVNGISPALNTEISSWNRPKIAN